MFIWTLGDVIGAVAFALFIALWLLIVVIALIKTELRRAKRLLRQLSTKLWIRKNG